MNSALIPAQWLPEVQRDLFRKLLQAMAYPGETASFAGLIPSGLGAIAALATLVDDEVSFCDPHHKLSDADRRFILAKTDDPNRADYILVDAARAPDFRPKIGTIYRPEEAATLIIDCPSELDGAPLWSVRGPGIETPTVLCLPEALKSWFAWRNEMIRFPQGIDLIICGGTDLVCLPRTTEITSLEDAK